MAQLWGITFFVENLAIVDLNHTEERSNCPCTTLAILPNCGDHFRKGKMDQTTLHEEVQVRGEHIVMMQLGLRMPLDLVDEVIALAAAGARQIYTLLQEEVRQHTLGLVENRGALSL